MDDKIGGSGLLQKIDQLLGELQAVRREVANLLVQQASTCPSEPSEMSKKPREKAGDITCISSLEELYAHDFTKKEDEKEDPLQPETSTSSHIVEPEESTDTPQVMRTAERTAPQDLEDLFVPSGSPEILEGTFEPKLTFRLHENLTIADKYLFANELFMGDQAELSELLSDIERLSSWSQLESYLYDVRQFGRDQEPVKYLVEFIKENSH